VESSASDAAGPGVIIRVKQSQFALFLGWKWGSGGEAKPIWVAGPTAISDFKSQLGDGGIQRGERQANREGIVSNKANLARGPRLAEAFGPILAFPGLGRYYEVEIGQLAA